MITSETVDRVLKVLLIVVIAWAAYESRESRSEREISERRDVQVDQLSIDDRKEIHAEIDDLRSRENADTRTTKQALDARGNLYRLTLDWQMRESRMTPEQIKAVNELAREAGLPDKSSVGEK